MGMHLVFENGSQQCILGASPLVSVESYILIIFARWHWSSISLSMRNSWEQQLSHYGPFTISCGWRHFSLLENSEMCPLPSGSYGNQAASAVFLEPCSQRWQCQVGGYEGSSLHAFSICNWSQSPGRSTIPTVCRPGRQISTASPRFHSSALWG